MTTKQTIDGVPRDLLERIADPYRREPGSIHLHNADIAELRALLDAPAYPNRLCHVDYTAHPYICGCLKGDEEAQRRYDEKFGKPAAQPQGEPVAPNSFWQWLDSAYRDGSKGEEPRFTKYNMEVAYSAGASAETPKGEPVGFRYRAQGEPWELMDESPFSDGRTHYRENGEELEPVYAEQPAPVAVVPKSECPNCLGDVMFGCDACTPESVAVVIPERKHIPDFTQHPMLNKEYGGWNACLDEVTRLNAKSR
ncbi:hypothetical protein HX810_20065 [Pseudomonas salomonii]|uniref:Uncharacterized protein n=1 Tax=Pseudomonas salomonii TaxID=191391 RepID=A0A7Y8KPF1_9PSED|nr:hypothetical protein [Pseudomonas salomonii]NWF09969.1 hypothetical protein [Pseudomonas salomonii]